MADMVRHLDRNSSVAWLVQSQSSTEGSGAAAAVGSAVTVVMVPPVFREAGLSVQRWLGSGKWRALQCGVMYTALQRGTGMGCTRSVGRPPVLGVSYDALWGLWAWTGWNEGSVGEVDMWLSV